MGTAVMSGELGRSERLSRAERMELAWAWLWPCALFGLVYDLLRPQFQLSEKPEVFDFVAVVLVFFLFSTWVIRRTAGMDFPNFRLLVVRYGAPGEPRSMTYRESLAVTWLICWRSAAIALVPSLMLTLLLRQPLDGFGLPSWLFHTTLDGVITYLWVVQSAIDKNYAGFSLRLERTGVEPWVSLSKVTLALDAETVRQIDESAERLGKPKSQVVSEAIAEYHSRIAR